MKNQAMRRRPCREQEHRPSLHERRSSDEGQRGRQGEQQSGQKETRTRSRARKGSQGQEGQRQSERKRMPRHHTQRTLKRLLQDMLDIGGHESQDCWQRGKGRRQGRTTKTRQKLQTAQKPAALQQDRKEDTTHRTTQLSWTASSTGGQLCADTPWSEVQHVVSFSHP